MVGVHWRSPWRHVRGGEGRGRRRSQRAPTRPYRRGGAVGSGGDRGPHAQISRGLRTVSPPRWGEDEEAGKHREEEGVCEARKKIR
jgi:hypothetical protein